MFVSTSERELAQAVTAVTLHPCLQRTISTSRFYVLVIAQVADANAPLAVILLLTAMQILQHGLMQVLRSLETRLTTGAKL